MCDTMLFRRHVPRSPLGLCIEDFWLYENNDGAHERELILPSGTFEMVFNLDEDELRIYNHQAISSSSSSQPDVEAKVGSESTF